ncbi:molybdopterin molybdotransferase MoeA [Arenibacter latericius]|uniref:molybdopterin molybdotransferase MoeA n=1 Tax=Arenibacter latericius TaxID=86104 RepID=UPI00040F00EF|nr:gephyrin-like molybdotransferase Glp [Arenibacter latericius]
MINVKSALNLVLQHASLAVKTEEVALNEALDFVLAKDVISEIDMPPFRQSAMDGYALYMGKSNSYKVLGEVKAGDAANPVLKAGEGVRIFTGAPVPDTANTVVMQEKVRVSGDRIVVDEPLNINQNIRPKGEQIRVGAIALPKGTKINSARIGFLASLGITTITVYKKPTISIIVTGNELITPGRKLSFGEIYESNGVMLSSVLSELGYKDAKLIKVEDDYKQTKEVLQKAINNSDVVLATGGISVGEYDFVGKALNAIGVEEIFYKVNQKPGKPLFFGKKGGVSLFALPGNPAAALSCFYIYVYPLLKKTEGACKTQLTRIIMPLSADYFLRGNRPQFLKAQVNGSHVHILGGQSSAMLSAFGDANALVYIPEEVTEIKKGEGVETILLPAK